jgi:DNA-binding MltR family transcriptional regulator
MSVYIKNVKRRKRGGGRLRFLIHFFQGARMAKKRAPEPNLKQLEAMKQQLNGQSDRAVALILTAWLDDCLGSLLTANMIDNAELHKKLLLPNQPLGTFSTKINLCFALGLISEPAAVDLHTIRDIRNDFAHYRDPLQFTDDSVKDRISNLRLTDALKKKTAINKASPRARFIVVAFIWVAYLLVLCEGSTKPTQLDEDLGEYVAITIKKLGQPESG